MKVAVLQLPFIGMSNSKLDYYVRIAYNNGAKVLLFGEYLLNPFFKSLVTMPISMIKEQSDHHISLLKELAKNYKLTIVAPIVVVKKDKPYKTIIKVAPNSLSYYYQQLLINYPHWNEEKFFANEIEPLKAPLVFTINRFKFAVMSGFELHFDPLWYSLVEKNVDAVLLPTVSTFGSNERWVNLIKMRAFTNTCYVVRANRVGGFQEDEKWKFYGDSLVVNPFGEIQERLGEKEEIMIVDLDHKEVLEARRTWGFKEALKKRL